MTLHEIDLKEEGKISRLTNRTFKFDSKISEHFYTAHYFVKTMKIIQTYLPNHHVTMQFFQRRDDSVVCGLDEVIALIHTFAKNPQDLQLLALNDGDIISDGEPVLKITGRYEDFGYLESLIDGILARRSSVATNVREVIKVLNGKDCFSMADRQDDYLTQRGDGYATYVAGIKKYSTNAQGDWVNIKGMGTMPHALIQMCRGDIVEAATLYNKTFPEQKVTALVDYNNDCVTDSLKVAQALREKLGAVRIDTSKALIDHYFDDKDTSGFDPHGVCPQLIFAIRETLDAHGFNHVKIIVSSGFDVKKIAYFESLNTPVDTYGVGSSFVRNTTVGFSGDLVLIDGEHEAKVGRKDIANPRLKPVAYPIY
ncbi:MAG TPA: nicotinate phosphoribosyltransferase [Bacilli bacterium]|nr:nicotinate phosphoribosyltransferase [Bacilli bacterium]